MVVSEEYTVRNRSFIRRYSDSGFYITCDQTGEVYSEAVDLPDTERTYSETDELIADEEAEDE
ncbi:MAG: hypothetical protein LIP12_01725 [Clostridiales bacterium]|nr:hypothetical protein [Clostridiales bacterium]